MGARLDPRPSLYRLLRLLPMPVIAILIGLIAGLAVWAVLDQVQSRAVKQIFAKELQARLDLRSRESLLRFDRYMQNYAAAARLLANHRRLAQYLEPVFWFPEAQVEPRVYEGFRPFWLPDYFDANALRPPSQVLLVDSRGQVREVYQTGKQPLSEEIFDESRPWLGGDAPGQPTLARLGNQPYLVVGEEVEDAGGYPMGSLVLVVPIDADFLTAAEGAVSAETALVALVDADDQQIMVSNAPMGLMTGTQLSGWREDFLVTSQSLPRYEGSNWNMLFATFIPSSSVVKMSEGVVDFERNQRFIAATVFIGVFTLLMYLVSARLNQVLKRMSRFSQRALDIERPAFERGGNQLLLLEDWIRQFTELVLRAREEMRQRHASQIRTTEALKAAIMEASLDAIISLNREGEVVDYNPTAQLMFGRRQQPLFGLGFRNDCLDPESVDTFNQMLHASALEDDRHRMQQARGELLARRADGCRFPIEISIVPIEIDEERLYTLYIHDATQRKAAEQESRKHQTELVHVCRLSTMGEVATGMAHELNQPLSAIVNYAKGASRRLQSGDGDRAQLVEAMRQISTQAQRAAEIIRRLRSLVGKQPPSCSQVDLNDLVREVMGFLEFEIKKSGVDVKLKLASRPIPVQVDLVQIEQVLLNLVRNAFDAVEERPAGERRVILTTRTFENHAMVRVEDNGKGIPEACMTHLFEPFFTTKDSGMGMGLAISETILANHGGRISAENLSGQGAVFSVVLPLVRSRRQQLSRAAEATVVADHHPDDHARERTVGVEA